MQHPPFIKCLPHAPRHTSLRSLTSELVTQRFGKLRELELFAGALLRATRPHVPQLEKHAWRGQASLLPRVDPLAALLPPRSLLVGAFRWRRVGPRGLHCCRSRGRGRPRTSRGLGVPGRLLPEPRWARRAGVGGAVPSAHSAFPADHARVRGCDGALLLDPGPRLRAATVEADPCIRCDGLPHGWRGRIPSSGRSPLFRLGLDFYRLWLPVLGQLGPSGDVRQRSAARARPRRHGRVVWVFLCQIAVALGR